MRCCLVLTDASVLFKVNNFKSENVTKIQSEWNRIADAITKMVELLVEFGFNGETLTSQNATIIIAYYLYNGGERDNDSKHALKMYLVHALLSGIFGSSQDQLLTALRSIFRTEIKDENDNVIGYKGKYKKFSFDEMITHELPTRVSLKIRKTDLDDLLTTRKGSQAFTILSLLYPSLKFSEVLFHQDHIHPFSKFTKNNLCNIGIPDCEYAKWIELRDMIPNLQLMEGQQNRIKSDTNFKEWIDSNYKDVDNKVAYILNNYLPPEKENCYEFAEFTRFFDERRKLIKAKLMSILHISDENQIVNNYYENDESDD